MSALAAAAKPQWQPYVTRIAQDFATGKLPRLKDVEAELMSRSLAEFVKGMWHIVEPATPLIWNWSMDAICDHVQAHLERKLGKQNLLIAVPPGSSKSTIVSVGAPAWKWIRNPAWRAIFASTNEGVSVRDSLKCRSVLDSQWYRETFDVKWHFAPDQNLKTLYKNNRTGFRQAITCGSRIIGERGDDLFIDDPLDAAHAHRKVERDDKINWYDLGYANRLNDLEMGGRCVVMQRLHAEDLIAHILEIDGDNTCYLCIPQEWDERRRYFTPLGWTDPRKADGELMFPQRFSAPVLVREKARLGTSGYAGQHQQLPSDSEGEVFKRGHAQFIVPSSILPATVSRSMISWDTAVKDGQQNDYSVSLVGTEFDRGIFISECIREKMKYPALKETAKLQASRVPVSALLIEDKQSGQQLIQELQQYTSLPIVPVQVGTDKVSRAWAVVPYWEANRVFFPCDENGIPEPWVEEFLAELYAFPKAAHDDQVDAFTQLLIYAVLTPSGQGWVEFLKKQVAAQQAAAAEQKQMDEIHHPVHRHPLNGAQ